MSILGNPFESYVKSQIVVRQKSLAKDITEEINPRSESILKALNTNVPWIRMASSVNITKGNTSLPGKSVYNQIKEKELFEGIEWEDDNLSKNFVLFGGVNNNTFTNPPTGNTGNPLQKAYGFGYSNLEGVNNNLGGVNSRGPVPLPGIQSVDFSYKNDGALAQASVKIKCFSPEQFQMIDILFQRPGYTVLLEFGHSVFLDNGGNLQYAGQGDYSYDTSPFNSLYNPQYDKGLFDLLDVIRSEKSKWGGNYEAFYGRITKFNWSFNNDGSYDITVNLSGLGDVITSLRLNVNPPQITENNLSDGFAYNDNLITSYQAKRIVEEGKGGYVELTKKQYLEQTNQTEDDLYDKLEPPTESTDIGGNYYGLDRGVSPVTPTIQALPPIFKHNIITIGDSVYFTLSKGGDLDEDDKSEFFFKSNKTQFKRTAYKLGSSLNKNSLSSAFTYELRRVREEMVSKMTGQGDLVSSYLSTPYPHIHGSTTITQNVLIPQGLLGIFPDDTIVDGRSKSQEIPVYLSFGTVLSMIQQFSNHYSNNIPLIQFNFSFINMGEDDNYFRTYPGLFSSDPTKILIPYKQIPENVLPDGEKPLTMRLRNSKGGVAFNKLLTTEKSSNFFTKSPNMGRLAYVYLNVNYLSEKYIEKINQNTNDVLTLEFLTEVLEDINSNLNGLNNFRVLHNKDTNKIDIISETPTKRTSKNLSTINTFGVTKTEGSFVQNLSLDSELSDNYSSQISIGAQNNGSSPQSNSLSFSTYNKGLIDRILPSKTSKGIFQTQTNPDNNTSPESPENLTWKDVWTPEMSDIFKNVYVEYITDSETLTSLKDLNNNISKFVFGDLTKKKLSPPPTFLPFNLKLEVKGLGGVKIYDSFQIDGKVLPSTYSPEDIELTVKSLSHKVDNNGWTTNIETFTRPKFSTNPTKIKTEEVPSTSKSGGGNGGNNSSYTEFVAGDEVKRTISGKTKSLTRGYDMTNLFWTPQVRQPVKQFYLHYTVTGGGPGPGKWFKSVIDGWNRNSSEHVSTPYLLDDEGNVEVLYNDVTSYGNHISRPSLHKISSAVEILNWGYLDKVGDKYYVSGKRDSGSLIPKDRVCKSVDKNGNPAPYRSKLYWHKMTDAQIEAIKKLTLEVCAKFNIPLDFSYEDCFPPLGKTSDKALAGTPGIYTHNSAQGKNKFDIHPQKELIEMLKGLKPKPIKNNSGVNRDGSGNVEVSQIIF